MTTHESGDNDEAARNARKHVRRHDSKTTKEERPSTFTHTSRHIEADSDAQHAAPEDVQTWTYRGDAKREKHVDKSFRHVFDQADEDETEDEQHS